MDWMRGDRELNGSTNLPPLSHYRSYVPSGIKLLVPWHPVTIPWAVNLESPFLPYVTLIRVPHQWERCWNKIRICIMYIVCMYLGEISIQRSPVQESTYQWVRISPQVCGFVRFSASAAGLLVPQSYWSGLALPILKNIKYKTVVFPRMMQNSYVVLKGVIKEINQKLLMKEQREGEASSGFQVFDNPLKNMTNTRRGPRKWQGGHWNITAGNNLPQHWNMDVFLQFRDASPLFDLIK